MLRSARYSFFILRVGLAIMFVWFGIDAFLHPDFWARTAVPEWLTSFGARFGASTIQVVYLGAVFEILAALSFVTGVFMTLFALLSAVFLGIGLFFSGVSQSTIHTVAAIGGLIAIALWPDRRR